ncbi:MAG: hypothetical protein ACHREM_00150 [Polyangiales bacterium]
MNRRTVGGGEDTTMDEASGTNEGGTNSGIEALCDRLIGPNPVPYAGAIHSALALDEVTDFGREPVSERRLVHVIGTSFRQFKPSGLVLPHWIAPRVDVVDIRVGGVRQFRDAERSFMGEAFDANAAEYLRLDMDMMPAYGQASVTLALRDEHLDPKDIQAVFFGYLVVTRDEMPPEADVRLPARVRRRILPLESRPCAPGERATIEVQAHYSEFRAHQLLLSPEAAAAFSFVELCGPDDVRQPRAGDRALPGYLFAASTPMQRLLRLGLHRMSSEDTMKFTFRNESNMPACVRGIVYGTSIDRPEQAAPTTAG